MITRRCTQRQFLLRPDKPTNETFLYCLAEAAQRFDIEVIFSEQLSNHHHTIVFDRHGTIAQFMGHLHGYVAKAVNAHRGRWENLWASEPPCLVRLIDTADVIAKVVYAATNPVKDHLVERAHQWPGVNTVAALLNRRPITIRRPRHFFRADGPMPETVTLEFTLPPELGDGDQIRREIRERVDAMERQVALERRRTGTRVLGRRAILRQSWSDRPSSLEPRRGLRPRVAARSKWSRIEALLRDRAFLISYREAWRRLRAGLAAVFPPGTYWLRRFANVAVAPAPPS